MKNKLVILALLLPIISQAQENYINYNMFNPDTCFTLQDPDVLYWDLNQDGTDDIFYYLVWHSAGGYLTYMKPMANWEWSNSIRIDQTHYQPLTDTTMIDETLYWRTSASFLNKYDSPKWWLFAFRYQAEDGIHYAWMHFSNIGYCSCCVSDMGYCTLPNQPIKWGQTELLAIKENDYSIAFATLHPNPTTGLVTIAGENLRQAEVLNMLGQQVLSVQGEGNELRIDMAALPAGVYFVNVTDDEGRKCVRKVVKE